MERRNYLCDTCGKKARNHKTYSPRCPHGCGIMRREDIPKKYRTLEEWRRSRDLRNQAWYRDFLLREWRGKQLLKRINER